MKFFSLTLLIIITMSVPSFSQSGELELKNKLAKYCKTLSAEFDQISPERQAQLKEIGDYIYEKRTANQPVKMTVICTHNSRRSHMGQLWFETAAAWYGLDQVETFSGGTEATAFNPRAVKALKSAGFEITKTNSSDNPTYKANYLKGKSTLAAKMMYSKKYSDSTNPDRSFAAVMVCSDADQSCPIVPGAEARFSLPFDDPKHYDGTPAESFEYEKTCRLIAREAFFAMQHAKKQMVADLEKAK